MAYNTEKIRPITEEDILSKTTEYDIYSYYIGKKIQIGVKFNSPLRKDNNPSFGLFISKKTNRLLFKDLATGISGNCFKFVKLYLMLTSYKEALHRIYTDLISNNIKPSTKGLDVKYNYKSTRTNIQIKRKNISNTDKEYFDKYNISVSTLKKFNVYPIYCFWVNGKLKPYKYSNISPMYAYSIYNKFKIYRPFGKENSKWFSNTNRYDIQGLQQLVKKGHTLIITKSLKDVMVLHELGYNSIAPMNENTLIPENIMSDLKSRFERIILLYDNDLAGILGMLKMKNKYKLTCRFIPIYYKNIKDISDFIYTYGKYKTINLLNKILT